MTAIRLPGFFEMEFLMAMHFRDMVYIMVIGHTVSEISRFSRFCRKCKNSLHYVAKKYTT